VLNATFYLPYLTVTRKGGVFSFGGGKGKLAVRLEGWDGMGWDGKMEGEEGRGKGGIERGRVCKRGARAISR
jgi:hypothetical protein